MIGSVFERLSRFDYRVYKYYFHSLYMDRPVAPFPFTIYVEPTNFCNLRCSICQSKDLTRERGIMDIELFKQLVDSLHGNIPSSIVFQFAGESLLNSNLTSMIAYAKKKDVHRTKLNTNGMLLDDDMIIRILQYGLDVLFIDMECNKEIYDKYRVGGDYDTVKRNILRVMELKKKLGLKKPLVKIFMIESKETTETDISSAYVDWLGVVDSVVVNHLGTQGNQVMVEDALDTYKVRCVDPFTTVFICWNGDVVPCCTDMNASMIMGNVQNESLLDIWKNEKYARLRDAIRKKNLYEYPLCSRCMM